MIKVDTYGDSVKSGTVHIFDLSCKYAQINKLPQLAMELQREIDGAMIPQGIGWRVSQTP